MASETFKLLLDNSKFVAAYEEATRASKKFSAAFTESLKEPDNMTVKLFRDQEKLQDSLKAAAAAAEREGKKFENAMKKSLATVTAFWKDFYSFVANGEGPTSDRIRALESRMDSLGQKIGGAAADSGPVAAFVDVMEQLADKAEGSDTAVQALGSAVSALALGPLLSLPGAFRDFFDTLSGGTSVTDRAIDRLYALDEAASRAVDNQSNATFFGQAATTARANARAEPRRFRQSLQRDAAFGAEIFGADMGEGPAFESPRRRGGGGGGGESATDRAGRLFDERMRRGRENEELVASLNRREVEMEREHMREIGDLRKAGLDHLDDLNRRHYALERSMAETNRRKDQETFRGNLEMQRQHGEEEKQIHAERLATAQDAAMAGFGVAQEAADFFGATESQKNILTGLTEEVLAIASAASMNWVGAAAHQAAAIFAFATAAKQSSGGGGYGASGGGGGGGPRGGAAAGPPSPSSGGSSGGDTIIMNFRGLKTSRELDEIVDGAIKRNGGRGRKIRRGDIEG